MVRGGKIEGISDLRDESDRDGMRILIELKRDAQSRVVLNQLYKHTPMQTTFGVIMLALVDGRPKVLTLKGLLEQYVKFRHEVILRRTRFDLDAAERRAHILEGFKIALDNIDAIIELIKASPTVDAAKDALIRSSSSPRCRRRPSWRCASSGSPVSSARRSKTSTSRSSRRSRTSRRILASSAKQMEIIKTELAEIRRQYGDERRTEIVDAVARSSRSRT